MLRWPRGGKLKPCRDECQFNNFMKRHFFFPRQYPAAQLIAWEIKKVLDREPTRKRTARVNCCGGEKDISFIKQSSINLKSPLGIWKNIRERAVRLASHRVPMFCGFVSFLKYLNGKRPGNQDLGLSYQPWRIWERRAAMHSAKWILFSNKQ